MKTTTDRCGVCADESILAAIADSGVPHGALLLFADNQNSSLDEDTAWEAEDKYLGSAWSVREWAEEWANDTGILDGIPEDLRNYFDYDAWARDGFMSGDIYLLEEKDGRIHVFHS
jgi:antirestriction protein